MRRITITLDEGLETALDEAPRRLGVESDAPDAEKLRAYARLGYEQASRGRARPGPAHDVPRLGEPTGRRRDRARGVAPRRRARRPRALLMAGKARWGQVWTVDLGQRAKSRFAVVSEGRLERGVPDRDRGPSRGARGSRRRAGFPLLRTDPPTIAVCGEVTTLHQDDLVEIVDQLAPTEMQKIAIGLLEVTQAHRLLGVTHPQIAERWASAAATRGGCDRTSDEPSGDRRHGRDRRLPERRQVDADQPPDADPRGRRPRDPRGHARPEGARSASGTASGSG